MREREYLRVTNLAKLRIAQQVVADVQASGARDEDRRRSIANLIDEWIAELEQRSEGA